MACVLDFPPRAVSCQACNIVRSLSGPAITFKSISLPDLPTLRKNSSISCKSKLIIKIRACRGTLDKNLVTNNLLILEIAEKSQENFRKARPPASNSGGTKYAND
jgi:hypothetical protein